MKTHAVSGLRTPHSLLMRRKFLMGLGGSALAVPVLESLLPRNARGQTSAPKRLLIVTHDQGRMMGVDAKEDRWSPGTSTGPLPAVGTAPSPMLAELAPIRDEIVTVDGVDNLLRHVTTMQDGHIPALVSALSCVPQAGEQWRPTEASLDYVAGTRLRSGPEMPASLVIPASATPYSASSYQDLRCFGPGGTDATVISGNPQQAVEELFGPPMLEMADDPSAPLSYRERLVARRGSLLDGVNESLQTLRQRVSRQDSERLEQHADFIRSVEAKFQGGGPRLQANTCQRPDESGMPRVVPINYQEWQEHGEGTEWSRGRQDALTWPYQLENLVQAFACDVARSMVLSNETDPTFDSEFPDGSPFEPDQELHNVVHSLQRPGDNAPSARDVTTAFQLWGRKFTQVVQRLAEIEDVDGSRLLDNTLIVWVSEMGYGSDHLTWNVPIVFAGMPSAFAAGQGRHLVEERRTLGDVWARVLRMLGGDDSTFGSVGTLGDAAEAAGVPSLDVGSGFDGYINEDTPLHTGDLDL